MNDRIIDEEVKNEEKSRRKSQVKSTTNEATFKNPGHHTPVKKHSGGNTSGMSSGSRDPNASIEMKQLQSKMSPSIQERLQNVQLGLGSKKH